MRYRYSGPNSAVTLKVIDGKGGLKDQDVVLWHGRDVELPANHEWVNTLLAKGFLAPIPVAPAAPKEIEPAPAKADKSKK